MSDERMRSPGLGASVYMTDFQCVGRVTSLKGSSEERGEVHYREDNESVEQPEMIGRTPSQGNQAKKGPMRVGTVVVILCLTALIGLSSLLGCKDTPVDLGEDTPIHLARLLPILENDVCVHISGVVEEISFNREEITVKPNQSSIRTVSATFEQNIPRRIMEMGHPIDLYGDFDHYTSLFGGSLTLSHPTVGTAARPVANAVQLRALIDALNGSVPVTVTGYATGLRKVTPDPTEDHWKQLASLGALPDPYFSLEVSCNFEHYGRRKVVAYVDVKRFPKDIYVGSAVRVVGSLGSLRSAVFGYTLRDAEVLLRSHQ